MEPLPPICIYCLTPRPLTDEGSDHVMPRAFGSFTNSSTLDCVCDGCNKYFGNTIEREMGRDSLEAVMRLIHGTKPASQHQELGNKRIRMSLDHEDPEWRGCHVVWREENGEPVASLVPQVGFKRTDGTGWVYVTEPDLTDVDKPLPPEVEQPPKHMRVVGNSEEMRARLMVILARRGVSFERTTQTEGRLSSTDGLASVTLHGSVDDTSFRCVGKIAFNYLAWCIGADFVRGGSFNPLRAYVRHGTLAPYPLVRVVDRPILADDTMESRQTDGHLVTASWTTPGNHHIVGQVSLFNSITYSVSLARDYVGLWLPLVTGHHFSHQTGAISMLVSARVR